MVRKEWISSQGGYIIRPVGIEALIEIHHVYQQSEDFLALGPIAEASLEMVERDLDKSQKRGGVYCGIFHPRDGMIGVVNFIPCGYEGDKQKAYLELLMIAKEYRSLGIGSDIFRIVELEIQCDPQIKTINAHVQVNNPAALAFWQRNGYQVSGAEIENPDQTVVYPLCKCLRGR